MTIQGVHICFEVADFSRTMAAAGVTPLFPDREYPEFGPGFFGVTYVDPDHNVIEFSCRSEPAPATPPPAG